MMFYDNYHFTTKVTTMHDAVTVVGGIALSAYRILV